MQVTIHASFAFTVEFARAPCKIDRSQRCFHFSIPGRGLATIVKNSGLLVQGLTGRTLFFSKGFSGFDFFCRQTSTSASVVIARRYLSEKLLARFRMPSKSSFPISRKAASGVKPGVTNAA